MKVFISSVIDGFEEVRAVAKSAVESLSMQPVMAEDFTAKPISPKEACLDGVRGSDIYVGILGSRYGHITKTGFSVTEEEFNEARKRGINVLWFVMNCTRDSKQEEFIKRIADYEGGYFIAFFDSENNLFPKIVQGLDEQRIALEGGAIDAKEATRIRNGYISELRKKGLIGPVIGATVFPAGHRDVLLSAVDLDRRIIRDQVKQVALFGSSAVFDAQLGTKELEGREYISFVQSKDRDQVSNTLSFDVYGALLWGAKLGGDSNQSSFLFDMYVIDEEEVQKRLIAFIHFAHRFYNEVLKIRGVHAFYVSGAILGIENKKIGRRPNVLPQSMGIGFGGMEDPLVVPREPMRIAQGSFNTPENLVSELLALIKRAFKAEGLYYE